MLAYDNVNGDVGEEEEKGKEGEEGEVKRFDCTLNENDPCWVVMPEEGEEEELMRGTDQTAVDSWRPPSRSAPREPGVADRFGNRRRESSSERRIARKLEHS